jgi:hypothetical protein
LSSNPSAAKKTQKRIGVNIHLTRINGNVSRGGTPKKEPKRDDGGQKQYNRNKECL